MTLNSIRIYCTGKKGVYEDFPFGNEVLVMKVGSKMFALINITHKPLSMNLKCEPYLAMILREKYPAVSPGYHMNKAHWNTVIINAGIPDKEIKTMIDISYDLVFKGLNKKEKDRIILSN